MTQSTLETGAQSAPENSATETAPIKIGVVGLGRAGWNIHVARLRKDPRFQITAVADLQEARRQEAAEEFGCATYRSFEELLAAGDCEMVVLASQSVDHGPQTIASLGAGLHVLVEKPMAMNTAEASAMIEAAEKAGKKLFVHQNYRYVSDVRHVFELIESGILGHVFEVRIRALRFSRRNDWQTLQKYGGGNLKNTCPHYIDVALLLLDSPVKRLFTDLQLTTDVGDADDHTKILLKGENGRVVDLEVSTSCALNEPKWTVLGTCGTASVTGDTTHIRYFDPSALGTLEVDVSPPTARRYGNDEVIPWQEKTVPATAEVASDFYDNVFAVLRDGAEQEVKPEQVREVIRIIEVATQENPLEARFR